MRYSVVEMARAVRRRLKRVVRKSRAKDYGRPAFAVLHLRETQGSVAEVAHRVRAARSSVDRWQSLYETYGEDAFACKLGERGRSRPRSSADRVAERTAGDVSMSTAMLSTTPTRPANAPPPCASPAARSAER